MLVCAFFAQTCTRDRGCSAHPAFPAPSSFEGHAPCKPRADLAARTRSRICSLNVESQPHICCRPGLDPGPNAYDAPPWSSNPSQTDIGGMGPGVRRDDLVFAARDVCYSGAAPTGGPPGGRCKNVIVA